MRRSRPPPLRAPSPPPPPSGVSLWQAFHAWPSPSPRSTSREVFGASPGSAVVRRRYPGGARGRSVFDSMIMASFVIRHQSFVHAPPPGVGLGQPMGAHGRRSRARESAPRAGLLVLDARGDLRPHPRSILAFGGRPGRRPPSVRGVSRPPPPPPRLVSGRSASDTRAVSGPRRATCGQVQDYDGNTPLMWAAREGHRACVNLLLDHGADESVADENGNTALHFACQVSRAPASTARRPPASLEARAGILSPPAPIAPIAPCAAVVGESKASAAGPSASSGGTRMPSWRAEGKRGRTKGGSARGATSGISGCGMRSRGDPERRRHWWRGRRSGPVLFSADRLPRGWGGVSGRPAPAGSDPGVRMGCVDVPPVLVSSPVPSLSVRPPDGVVTARFRYAAADGPLWDCLGPAGLRGAADRPGLLAGDRPASRARRDRCSQRVPGALRPRSRLVVQHLRVLPAALRRVYGGSCRGGYALCPCRQLLRRPIIPFLEPFNPSLTPPTPPPPSLCHGLIMPWSRSVPQFTPFHRACSQGHGNVLMELLKSRQASRAQSEGEAEMGGMAEAEDAGNRPGHVGGAEAIGGWGQWVSCGNRPRSSSVGSSSTDSSAWEGSTSYGSARSALPLGGPPPPMVDLRNHFLATPLHRAAAKGHAQVCARRSSIRRSPRGHPERPPTDPPVSSRVFRGQARLRHAPTITSFWFLGVSGLDASCLGVWGQGFPPVLTCRVCGSGRVETRVGGGGGGSTLDL